MPLLPSRWILLIVSLSLIPLSIVFHSTTPFHHPIPPPHSTTPFHHIKSKFVTMTEDNQALFAARAAELHEYIFSQPPSTFENKPWAIANAIEVFAQTKDRMMTFKDKKLDVARAQLVAQQPAPRTILEFGTFVGKSALAWGAILREIHGEKVPADVNVYTFEVHPQMVSLARDLVKLAGLDDIVHVLEGPASESLKKLHAEGRVTSVDVAFFDHWEQFYLPDLQLIEDLGLFRVGSLAIADNTDFPGAPDYLKYVKAGGRGVAGSVKYESKSLGTDSPQGKPNVVEVSTVVAV